MKQAVLFDLDGTLADTLVGITHFVNRALAQFGYSSLSPDDVRRFTGHGAAHLIERSLTVAGGIDKLDEVLPFYENLYNACPLYKLKAFDGIPELLQALQQHGIKVAVLSNKPHEAVEPIAKWLFGENVDIILGHKDGMRHKPAQDGVNYILDTLGIAPKDCAYVGDSGVDMLTGKRGGMFTVGVTWGFRAEGELFDNGADAIAHTVSELQTILLGEKI